MTVIPKKGCHPERPKGVEGPAVAFAFALAFALAFAFYKDICHPEHLNSRP
jgi:hypothetical protein